MLLLLRASSQPVANRSVRVDNLEFSKILENEQNNPKRLFFVRKFPSFYFILISYKQSSPKTLHLSFCNGWSPKKMIIAYNEKISKF